MTLTCKWSDMKLLIDAHPDPMMGLMPMYLAIEQGLFTRRGIETAFVERSAVQAIEDMRSGRMNLSFSGPTLTIMAWQRFDLETRVVSPAAIRGSYAGRTADFCNVYARHDVPVREPRDFENLRLGAFALDGGITHSAPLHLLKRAGVDVQRLQWRPMPFHQMPAALERGDIDVALCVEPFTTQIESRGLGYPVDHVLGAATLAMAATGNPSLASNWWTTRASYAHDPQLFDLAHDALAEATAAIYADPEQGFDALARHTRGDLRLLREVGLKSTVFFPFSLQSPTLRTMYQRWVDVLHGAGLLDRPVDVATLLR